MGKRRYHTEQKKSKNKQCLHQTRMTTQLISLDKINFQMQHVLNNKLTLFADHRSGKWNIQRKQTLKKDNRNNQSFVRVDPTSPPQTGFRIRSIFSAVFSFTYIKVKEHSLPYYLFIPGGIPFPRVE